QRATVRPGEHITVVAVVATDRLAVLGLALALGSKRRKGDRIEGQAASGPFGLGRRVVDLVVDDPAGGGGGEGGGGGGAGDPAQPGQLAAAHASGGDQQPQGVQAVVADMVE